MESPKYYWLCLIILLFLEACGGSPTSPIPNLPPSASDLDILDLNRLCDKKEIVRSRSKNSSFQESPWGSSQEWYTEIRNPLNKTQWLFFNDDDILVAVVTAYPLGLNLKPYPVLRNTLSELEPAREFFTNTNSLIKGDQPDTVLLYRTGDIKTTTQYVVRQNKDHEGHLLVAVVVLDPYEPLLDGAQEKFMSKAINALNNATATKNSSKQEESKFLANQQFARGETALFESCPGKKPDIAIDAYRRAIQLGLDDTKRLAEAHHRLGLALRNKGQLTEARMALEQSLKITPHSPRVLNSLGTVLTQLKKHSLAITSLEKAIALQPNYARARYNLAEAYEAVNSRRAIEEYETYLALVENIPEESTRAALAKDRLEKLQ